MAIYTRRRFEVFKRDDFACTYCGRKVPDVTLEVDHIVPRAQGGGDEVENLTTSCMDCNRGKGGIPLENKSALVDLSERIELMQERERQIRAYNRVKEIERQRIEQGVTEAWNYWFRRYDAETLHRWYAPNESILRHYVKHLPLVEVLEAIDITVSRFPGVRAAAPKYLGGVLRQKLKHYRSTL